MTCSCRRDGLAQLGISWTPKTGKPLASADRDSGWVECLPHTPPAAARPRVVAVSSVLPVARLWNVAVILPDLHVQ